MFIASSDDCQQLLTENTALRESQQLLQSMLDALPDLFWLKDADGRYQVVNRAFCQFHGLLREQIIGKTADELFAPGIVAGIRAGDRAIIEQGGFVRDVVRVFDSGAAAGWVETTKSLIYDQDDVLLGIAGMTRDITERKRLEGEVYASEQKLRTLFEILPVGVAITDEQHRIVEMNPTLERILDMSLDQILGGSHAERTYLLPDGTPTPYDDLPSAKAIAEQRTIYENEVGIIKAEGVRIWTSISAAPLPIAGLGAVVVAADITERKRAEEQRLQIERRLLETQRLESLGVLAGGIAHDFNNLLAGILGYAELVLQELPPASSVRSDIEAIIRGAHEAAELTNQMLAYSGKGHFVTQPVYMNTLIQQTNELLETSIAKNCLVRYHFAAQLPAIEADARQIRQVILNLLINAAEAIDAAGGTITLITALESLTRESLDGLMFGANQTPGPYVRLTVADTGRGMDEATLAHIFDPFFTTKFTGRGLGLAAVQGIVRGHHGALRVTSEPGAGTVFSVWFPTSAVPPGSTTTTGRGVVLVIDDEETVRTLVARQLEHLGFASRTAGAGADGLALLRTEAANLVAVLLDAKIVQIHGDVMVRAIQKLQPGTPVVLMIGHDNETTAQTYAGVGLTDVLGKPFTLDDLRAVLERAER
jgi:PAS domain S-box-containing protein